ncbi:unnamed protein product, partial [Closterium sp. NIES-53]
CFALLLVLIIPHFDYGGVSEYHVSLVCSGDSHTYLPAAPALSALLLLLLPLPLQLLLLAVARCSSNDVRASLSRPSSFVSGTLVGVVAVAIVAVALELVSRERLVVASRSCSGVRVTHLRPSSFVSGTLRVEGLWVPFAARTSFAQVIGRVRLADEAELPDWVELLGQRVDIFALDYDAILTAMYALPTSTDRACYLCVPPDPGIEPAALGADEAAALGARASLALVAAEAAALGASASPTLGAGEAAAPGAGESALSSIVPAEALYTFTLDSSASRSFFRDTTTLTPLSRPVVVSLADPSGGPVLAHSSTVLPCPAVPSGSLSGLHLPSFSTNLVSGADLQDCYSLEST